MWTLRVGVVVVILSLVGGASLLSCGDHEELTRTLHRMAHNYSSITSLNRIGESVEGRGLWVLTMGSEVGLRPVLRPQVKLVANIFGNSAPACGLLLTFVEELLQGYYIGGSGEEMRLLQNLEIQALFDMNPDGTARSLKGDCKAKDGSTNANDVRLNRDFPEVFPTDEDTSSRIREPETEAVIKWSWANYFVLSLSLVSGHNLVIIPFDDRLISQPEAHETPDNDVFTLLAQKYTRAIGWRPSVSNCPIGKNFSTGYINGAAESPARGTMMDFSYILAGTPELTIGVACCKNDGSEEAVQRAHETHRKGLYTLLNLAANCVRGQVLDGVTEDVLDAVSVTRVAETMLEPVPWITSLQGEFFRVLPPGKHVLEFQREGYKTARAEVSSPFHRPITVHLYPLSYTPVIPDEEEIDLHQLFSENEAEGRSQEETTSTPTTTTEALIFGEIETNETTLLPSNKKGKFDHWPGRFHKGLDAMWGAFRSRGGRVGVTEQGQFLSLTLFTLLYFTRFFL